MPHADLGDACIAYDIAGRGEPVLFISGLNGLGAFWRNQFQAFSGSFTTISFDHRGIGGSNGAPPYSLEQWASDAVRLLDHLGLSAAHLVGHSTGGVIAQVIASDHPARVLSAVLGGTWAWPDNRFRHVFELRRDVLMRLGFAAYDSMSTLMTCPPNDPWPGAGAQAETQPPASVIEARLNALLAYDAGERLRRIVCPTIVVAAQDDALIPPRMSQAMADAIAGARTVLLSSGGHLFPRTRGDEYTQVVFEFIKSVGSRSGADPRRKGA